MPVGWVSTDPVGSNVVTVPLALRTKPWMPVQPDWPMASQYDPVTEPVRSMAETKVSTFPTLNVVIVPSALRSKPRVFSPESAYQPATSPSSPMHVASALPAPGTSKVANVPSALRTKPWAVPLLSSHDPAIEPALFMP